MLERLKWILPAIFLLVAMIMLATSSREPGRPASPAMSLVMEVVGPVENVLTISARAVIDIFDHYFYLVRVRQENENLRKIIDDQKELINQTAEYRLANERLTTLLGLRQAYPSLVMKPAYILAWDPGPWLRAVTISIGSLDGVALDQAVIHPTGVVGRVVAVSPNYAQVMLTTDFNSSIDAFIQRTRAVGILSGQGDLAMTLKYLRKTEDVRPGDKVVTSGLDGIFPGGLALGLVTRVDRQNPEIFAYLQVAPTVVFTRLEEVMVVINQAPSIDWLTLAPRLRPLLEEGAGVGSPIQDEAGN